MKSAMEKATIDDVFETADNSHMLKNLLKNK
jgi:hypothetical protein